jgi:hypothetical protein
MSLPDTRGARRKVGRPDLRFRRSQDRILPSVLRKLTMGCLVHWKAAPHSTGDSYPDSLRRGSEWSQSASSVRNAVSRMRGWSSMA